MSEIRRFPTGATRDTEEGKYDYEAFLSPIVIERFAEYMHKHRFQKDGSVRSGDNWQLGFTLESYMKSGSRHAHDWWMLHRGFVGRESNIEEALCALWFNVQGYLHETLKKRGYCSPNSAAISAASNPTETKPTTGGSRTSRPGRRAASKKTTRSSR